MDVAEEIATERVPIEGVEAKRCTSCGETKPIEQFRAMNLPGSAPGARLKTCNSCIARKGQSARKKKRSASLSGAEIQIAAQKAVLDRHADEVAEELERIREEHRRASYEAELAPLLTKQAKERASLARKHGYTDNTV